MDFTKQAFTTPNLKSADEILRAFYRIQAIENHRKRKLSWPWYGRFQHWLFCSWRCPACKAQSEITTTK